MPPPVVTISQRDWSLHRQGPIDMGRHNEKVKEAIKGDLGKIIGEEAIITGNPKKIVKIPIRSVYLPHFRYGDNAEGGDSGVGQGPAKQGDTIAPPGSEPGIDYYEADLTIEDLASLLFEDLGLPYLKPKSQELETESIEYNDVSRHGSMSNLDKRRTIMENMRRNAMDGHPEFDGITDEDLRYKTWETKLIEDSSAVILACRDISGSMGEFEKYITRSFYFWMVRFLRSKYRNVEIAFITHHTEAKEVDEKAFFELGESGGTKVSSAYALMQQIIEQRYSSGLWNIYPFHFSDGDNESKDNDECVRIVQELLKVVNAFGYGEIHGPSRVSYWGMFAATGTTLMKAFESITAPTFIRTTISKKEDVYPALKTFFTPDETLVS